MSGELIALIISMSVNVIIALGSVISTIYTCRITNLENIYKFKKSITKEELNFKDLKWFEDTIKHCLGSYNWLSRKRIIKKYNELKEN